MADQVPSNKRALMGLAFFGVLVLANLFVRFNRPGPATAPVPVASPPIVSVSQPLPANQIPGSGPVSIAKKDPLDQIRSYREQLEQLPIILRMASYTVLFASPSRNPFVWNIPALDIVASEAPLPSAPIPLILKPDFFFSGSFTTFGRRAALFRIGREMHVLGEGERVPHSKLVVSSIASNSAVFESEDGAKENVYQIPERNDKVAEAVRILKGEAEKTGYPIRDPGSFSVPVASGPDLPQPDPPPLSKP